MRIVILASLLGVVLAGCTTTSYLKNGVERVCEMDEAERLAVRATVDARIAPHQLRLTCADETMPGVDGDGEAFGNHS